MFSHRAAWRWTRIALLVVCSLFLPSRVATATNLPDQDHRLLLFHLHTSERIDIVYKKGDLYLPDAVDRLDHFKSIQSQLSTTALH